MQDDIAVLKTFVNKQVEINNKLKQDGDDQALINKKLKQDGDDQALIIAGLQRSMIFYQAEVLTKVP